MRGGPVPNVEKSGCWTGGLSGTRAASSTGAVACRGNRQKGDCRRRERQRAGGGRNTHQAREIAICLQLQSMAVQAHGTILQVGCTQRVALACAGKRQRAWDVLISVDDQKADAAPGAALAMCIDVQTRSNRY